jgi:hypothetical protein
MSRSAFIWVRSYVWIIILVRRAGSKSKKGQAEGADGSDAHVRVLVCLPLFVPANSAEEVGSSQALLNPVRVYHLEAHRRLVHAAVANGTHRAFNFWTNQDGAAAAVRLKLETNRLCRRKNRSGRFPREHMIFGTYKK